MYFCFIGIYSGTVTQTFSDIQILLTDIQILHQHSKAMQQVLFTS